MKKRKIIVISILSIFIVLASGLVLSNALFSTTQKQQFANTFKSGCLSIKIDNVSSAIDMNGAYPVTDIDGLLQTKNGYTFKITNNCEEPTKYQIRLEEMSNPETLTTLKTEYLRVSLSSDTMDNLIYTLSELPKEESEVSGSFGTHKLYTGEIAGNGEKEFTLKEWLEYNTTKEQGAEKSFLSKINVIAATNIEEEPMTEIKFDIQDNTATGTIKGTASSITYCETKGNECNPTITGTITDTTTSIAVKDEETKPVSTALGTLNVYKSYKRMICVKLDSKETICSNPDSKSGIPDFIVTSNQVDNGEGICTFNGENVTDMFGHGVTLEENCQKIYKTQTANKTHYLGGLEIVGNAIWDETQNKCTYQNFQVYDFDRNVITSKDKCNMVYTDIMGTGYSNIEEAGTGIYINSVGKTGIYETEDDDGPSYYYRGNVTNNYVDFAECYWRIIRINGNGSIRLIYSGKKSEIESIKNQVLQNNYQDTNNYKFITLKDNSKKAKFNNNIIDNAYVGLMYGKAGATNYADTHTNTYNSNIKEELDYWYQNNLQPYANNLDINAGFCGDRSTTDLGYGRNATFYAPENRLRSFSPTLKCQNLANDYYTIKSAYKGNNALINPVGLITADEAALAGGTYLVSNLSYYLYTVNPYWTMSPYSCDGSADVFFVNSDGILNNIDVNDTRLGVRPVINLSATTNFSGSGTVGDPYVVVD